QQVPRVERADVGRAVRRREVLADELEPGVDRLCLHLRAQTRLPRVVEDRHAREVADAPARTLHPEAEIRLLGVDEEALVEEPGALERLATQQEERAGGPVAVDLPVVER